MKIRTSLVVSMSCFVGLAVIAFGAYAFMDMARSVPREYPAPRMHRAILVTKDTGDYVLVLTTTSTSYQGGSAITWIGGFASNSKCVAAGNAWLKHHRATQTGNPRDHFFHAICLKRDFKTV